MDTKIQTLLDKKGREVYSIQVDQTVYDAIIDADGNYVIAGITNPNGNDVYDVMLWKITPEGEVV